MKKILSALVCSIFLFQLWAFNWKPAHTPTKKYTNSQTIDNIKKIIGQQFASNKATLSLNNESNLLLQANRVTKNGYEIFKYDQFYKNVPIEFSSCFIRSKNNQIQSISGKLIDHVQVNVKPSITSDRAVELAIQYLGHKLYAWQDEYHQNYIKKVKNDEAATFYPKAALVIVDSTFQNKTANFKLAYKIDIYSVEPLSRQIVYVDAHNGDLLTAIEKIHQCSPTSITCNGHYNKSVEIEVCLENGEYILEDFSDGGMQVFSSNNTESSPNIPITDEDGNFANDTVAVDVHYATQQVDAYFRTNHNHFGIDNTNTMPYINRVHFGDTLKLAFWDGYGMTYGNGNGDTFGPPTSLDIVAHEIVHGIIDFSSNLLYFKESGALHESFADFFGEVIEDSIKGTNDWIVGAKVVKDNNKDGLRKLANPKDPRMLTQQPDTYKGLGWYHGYKDNGGVHINSGVHNYLLYLLVEGGSGLNDHGHAYNIAGLGMQIVAEMAYECMTTLPPNAGFHNSRNNFIQIAQSYGSEEVEQVKAAFDAVGIYDCSVRDRAALIAMYNALDGPNWKRTWDTLTNYTQWSGVKVNDYGCVTCLDLDSLANFLHDSIPSGNGLSGELPTEISWLSSLETLILSNNNISGELPPEIGNLVNLQHLLLDRNGISGNLPVEIGKMTNLINLFMPFNNLSGPIPKEIGDMSSLWYIFLGYNNLDGPIPQELEKLKNLRKVYIDHTNLEGSIPDIFDDLDKITELSFAFNQHTGEIPKQIQKLHQLQHLYLEGNQFEGSIPYELGLIDTLYVLNLAYNNLTGTIPSSIGKIINLSEFYIRGNGLSGCLDSTLLSLCYKSKIDSFLLTGNNYTFTWEDFCTHNTNASFCELDTAQIRSNLIAFREATGGDQWITKWHDNISYKDWFGIQTDVDGNVIMIDLDENGVDDGMYSPNGNGNNLTGYIPDEITHFPKLEKLFLSNNSLTGNINSHISQLTSLQNLALSNNEFTGKIPYQFSALVNLQELRLDNNNLGNCFYESLNTLCSSVDLISIDENNNFMSSWNEFCNNGQGNCGRSSIIKGDCNADENITIEDMLYLCNAMNRLGSERLAGSLISENWDSAADGINDKHKDINGDGIIDTEDLEEFKLILEDTQFQADENHNDYKDSQVVLHLKETASSNEDSLTFISLPTYRDGRPFNGSGIAGYLTLPNHWAVNYVNIKFPIEKPSFFKYDEVQSALQLGVSCFEQESEQEDQHMGITIIIKVDDLITGDDITFIKVNNCFSSSINHTFDDHFNQIINVSPSTTMFVKNNTLKAEVNIIHKQKINLGQASIRITTGQAPFQLHYNNATKQFNANEEVLIDSLEEGRYLVEVLDSNDNSIKLPIYVNGPQSICNTDIILNTPTQSSEQFNKILWNDTIALLQYKHTDIEKWTTVLDYDGATILEMESGQYQIRSKYPCINGDIYSDTLTIYCTDLCLDKTPPEAVCLTENIHNNCSPTFIPQPLELINFDVVDNNTPADSILFNVDAVITNRPNFTIYDYTYSFTDKAGNTSFCEEQYTVANEILQAPVADGSQVICQDELWCFDQIGKYHLYANDRGMPGNLLFSLENTEISVCSNIDSNIDTSIPGLYNLWATEFKTFPDGSICESEPTPFSLNVYPKPTATLKETNKIVELDPINLMDLIEDNKSGYWTGENVITVPDPLYGDITYFHATEPGKTKLYYTVKNEYCSQSYLLVMIAMYSENFKLYPNPTKEKAYLQFDEKINVQNVTIYNIDGRVVKYLDVNTQNNIALDVSYLKKGIYLIKITTAQSSSIQKLFIE